MTKKEAIKEIEEYIVDADKAISMDEEYIRGWKCALLTALGIVYSIEDHTDCDLISRKALLEAYDKAHKGPPGGARKLIVEAPGVWRYVYEKE